MTLRRHTRSEESCTEGGLGGFVRGLLSNIPWSESLEREVLPHQPINVFSVLDLMSSYNLDPAIQDRN